MHYNSHEPPGVKPCFGLGGGRPAVEHEFSGGTLGTQSSSQTPPLNGLKAEVDWIGDNARLRAGIFSWSGQTSGTVSIRGRARTTDYTATDFSIGVFVFFRAGKDV